MACCRTSSINLWERELSREDKANSPVASLASLSSRPVLLPKPNLPVFCWRTQRCTAAAQKQETKNEKLKLFCFVNSIHINSVSERLHVSLM
jgi:hypothetical protein